MDDEIVECSMDMILNAGNARNECFQALEKMKNFSFCEAAELLEQAKQNILKSHQAHTGYMQRSIVSMYKILLACGAGCSSGLVAQRMRKYAKRNNIEAQIRAVGDAEIINCVEDYDILMLGPHLQYELPKITASIQAKGLTTIIRLITKEQYAALDGESVLKDVVRVLDEATEI